MHRYQDLITIFNDCFAEKYNTKLERGGDEPIYLPAETTRSYHAIFFAHGFFSSALHECSHWLIAGKERRKQVDFGYWYLPDGRTDKQQALFERVEVKPQAMEWILSAAAGYPFRVSIDNLNGMVLDTHAFKDAVYQQVLVYCKQGLPSRATSFRNALSFFYGTSQSIKITDFNRASLDTWFASTT